MHSFGSLLAIVSVYLPQESVQTPGEWSSVGHGSGWAWAMTLQRFAPLVLGLLLLLLFVQAWRGRRRYRAVETLDMGSVDRLRRAVAEAETETTGEIGVVVLERSDAYPEAPWIGAVILTILTSLSFSHLLDLLPFLYIVGLQLFAGYLFYGLIGAIPDLRRRFVSSSRASIMSEEQAIQEFHTLKLSGTEHNTGVLVFVSLFERRVVVLADDGIADQVDQNVWIEVDRAVLSGAKRNELESGLLSGVGLVSTILKQQFPEEPGTENQIEDHVIVRRE